MSQLRRVMATMTAVERELFHAIGGRIPAGVRPNAVEWYEHPRRRHLWEGKKRDAATRRHGDAESANVKRIDTETRRHGDTEIVRQNPVLRVPVAASPRRTVAASVYRPGDAVLVRRDARSRFAGMAATVTRPPRQPAYVTVRLEGRSGEEQVPAKWMERRTQPPTAA